MGLDVSAYKNIKKVENPRMGEDGYLIYDEEQEGYILAYTLEGFEDRIKNLEWQSYYKGESTKFGVSCSYGGHNRFRESICKMFGITPDIIWNNREAHKEHPFYELVDFADNEGVLDYECASKLHGDFLDYQEIAEAKLNKHEYNHYCKWIDVLKAASENGCVVFS